MAKAITLERAVWEAFFWPEDVPRYIEVSKEGTLEEVWTRNVASSPNREALVTSEATATYGSLERASVALSREFPDQCQFAILAGLKPIPRLVASLASTKAGCVTVLLDAPWGAQSLSQLNLSASKIIVIGDSDLPVKSEKRVGSKQADELIGSENSAIAVPPETSPPRRSGKLVLFSEDGAPVYLGEKAQNSRLESAIAFFSMKQAPIIFHVGSPYSALGGTALGLALRLGGTLVSSDTIPAAARIAADKGLSYDYGFLDSAAQGGAVEPLQSISGLRRNFGGCRWMVSSAVDPAVQVRLERTLRVPALGCLSTVTTGLILSNHYSWNVHGSFGVPLPNAEAAIQGKTGAILATGQSGELIVSGSQIDRESAPRKAVAPGNWTKTGLTIEVDLNGLIHPFVQR